MKSTHFKMFQIEAILTFDGLSLFNIILRAWRVEISIDYLIDFQNFCTIRLTEFKLSTQL